jgi:hypothetical protein
MRTLRGVGRRLRHPIRTVRPPPQPLNPQRMWGSPDVFWRTVETVLSGMERPYLALAVRTTPSLPGSDGDGVRGIMEDLLTRPLSRRLRFTTPEEGLRLMGHDPGGGA